MQQRKKETMRMTRTIILILALSITPNIAAPTAYDPQLEIKSSWQDTSLTPIISEPCPTMDERCWEWLPAISPEREDDEGLSQEVNRISMQEQRRLDEELYSRTIPWKEDSRIFVPRTRPSSTIVQPIPPKPIKKDNFPSRSWGAGGMPFSVLYLTSARPNNRSNTEETPTKGISVDSNPRQLDETPHSPLSPPKHPNYRVALRNGAPGLPRRQYSIIPQLFVSYGWGPLGK